MNSAYVIGGEIVGDEEALLNLQATAAQGAVSAQQALQEAQQSTNEQNLYQARAQANQGAALAAQAYQQAYQIASAMVFSQASYQTFQNIAQSKAVAAQAAQAVNQIVARKTLQARAPQRQPRKRGFLSRLFGR